MYVRWFQSVIEAVPSPPPLSDDRITMILTAVAVIAAFGGIMLGISALAIGYLAYRGKKDIETEARRIAQKVARKEANKVAREVAEEYLQENSTVADLYGTQTAEIEKPLAASKVEEEMENPDDNDMG